MADWLTWDGGSLTADAVTMIDREDTSEPTDHPIESGGVITDHFLRRPGALTVTFVQSRLSLRDQDLEWKKTNAPAQESRFQPQGLLLLSTAVAGAVGAIAGALGFTSPELTYFSRHQKSPDTNRVQDVHDTLLSLLDDAKECRFEYQGEILTGYYVTSVRKSVVGGSGGKATFTIELREVQTVQTAAASLVGFEVPGILSAIPTLDLGRTAGVEKVAEDFLANSKLAKDIGVNELGGAF